MDATTRIQASILVHGMRCPGSEAVVLERQLTRCPGVLEARVSGMRERAYVTIDPEVSTVEAIRETIREAGYAVGAVEERRRTADGGFVGLRMANR
jgi:copper chaperone CopZ